MKLVVEVLAPSAGEKKLRARVKKTAQAAFKKIPKNVTNRLLKKRTAPFQLEIAFLSAQKMQTLNRQYRKKNRPTDVLSFDGAPYSPSLGQLVLCWPVIKKQAKYFSVAESEELERMIIHGLLHLCGYEHEKSAAEARKMFRLQEKILCALRGGQVLRGQLFK